jgi:hypothetical protein
MIIIQKREEAHDGGDGIRWASTETPSKKRMYSTHLSDVENEPGPSTKHIRRAGSAEALERLSEMSKMLATFLSHQERLTESLLATNKILAKNTRSLINVLNEKL